MPKKIYRFIWVKYGASTFLQIKKNQYENKIVREFWKFGYVEIERQKSHSFQSALPSFSVDINCKMM